MRINNVSFGSTYAIKYNYALLKAYGYATPNNQLRTFIGTYNTTIKADDAISAINPVTQTYYIKIPNSKDKYFEKFAKDMSVKSKIRKVNNNEMRGAIITSVGRTKNELDIISDKIAQYEHSKYMESKVNEFEDNYYKLYQS